MNRLFPSRLRLTRALPLLAVLVLMLTALRLASDATSAVSGGGDYYVWIIAAASLALMILVVALLRRIWRIARALKARAPGSRLSARLALVFVALSVPPAIIVYWFSLQFLSDSIDSWFDVRLETAMEDALELGQVYLESRERQALDLTRRLARRLALESGSQRDQALEDFIDDTRARHAAVFDNGGRIIHAATLVPRAIIPDLPDESVLLRVMSGGAYSRAEPTSNNSLRIRALAPLPNTALGSGYFVQAVFAVPDDYNELASNVEREYLRYEQLGFLRTALKQSYILILSLVLLFGILLAMLLAMNTARRLVAPIGRLAAATEEVAAGHYNRQLDVPSDDELGFLVGSFNRMTSELQAARLDQQASSNEIDAQRRYLQTLLQSLSSGVLSLTSDGRIRTANASALQILSLQSADLVGKPVTDLAAEDERLQPLVDLIEDHANHSDWRSELVLNPGPDPLVLMCRGALLPGEDGGVVVIFDDTTVLNQAQRDAAWGEVARRLAHEVKNPLTPIQLAAERLSHKFLGRLDDSDQQVFARLTHTIVAQVEALKLMVDAFSDYARGPRLELKIQSLYAIINEAVELFAGSDLALEVDLVSPEPLLAIDAIRIRQLLNNLLKNAQEATENTDQAKVWIRAQLGDRGHQAGLTLTIDDNGPGLPEGKDIRLFEPYATTKQRGTGLGLSIVRKIMEEHGGRVDIGASDKGGAQVSCWFPITQPTLD